MELKCEVQQYAWGKLGKRSKAAEFAANGRPDDFCVDGTAPYAELWMGTHPNGPSKLAGPGAPTLAEHIAKNPAVLGEESRKRFGDNLPFLFKVLSVNKALSIQAHPDKKHAEELHAKHPDIYKDPNHKPEMAIALTEFEGLCGFRPLSQIQANLKSVPQLVEVIGSKMAEDLGKADKKNYGPALKAAFTALMKCDKKKIETALASLKAEVEKKSCQTGVERLFLKLHQDYPGDVGCFVIYFLNHLVLQPGEAMFLGPNLPHAYLSGDCMECMACSDNVVRAGLTPKLIDVPTLCEMLIYDCPEDGKVDEAFKFNPTKESANSVVFDAPVPDFSVAKLDVKNDKKSVRLPGLFSFRAFKVQLLKICFVSGRKSASIVIVVDCHERNGGTYGVIRDGKAVVKDGKVKKGLVLFLEANDILEMATNDDSKEDINAYQAFC